MIVAGISLYGGVAEGGTIVLGHKYSARALERQEAHDVKFYLQMLARREHDPAGFDLHRPVIGKVLSDPAAFEYWFDRWQANPARFEHWHPCFWHLLHGEALASVTIAPPPPLKPPAGEGPEPPAPPGGPPDNPPPHVATPEPSSLLLIVVSLGILLLVQGGRRCLHAA